MTPQTEAFINTQRWRHDPIARFVAQWIDHPHPHPFETNTCPICSTVTERSQRMVDNSSGGTTVACPGTCRDKHYQRNTRLPPDPFAKHPTTKRQP